MPISERMLRKWRGQALTDEQIWRENPNVTDISAEHVRRYCLWILQLTQELLDQALLRKETTK